MMTAAFSQIELTLLRRHRSARRESATYPELSENSESMKAAVAIAWPCLSSTFLMALAIFLNVFISARVYDLACVQ